MFLPSIDLNVSEKLKRDPEFRQRFFVAESSAQIARHLIALRKRRGLSQAQLAEKLGTQQPAISRVESADYRNWSYNTLRKAAEALDARLRVILEPAEDVFKEYEVEEELIEKSPLAAKIDNQAAFLPPQEIHGRIPDTSDTPESREPLRRDLPFRSAFDKISRPEGNLRQNELQRI
jgi:transcriptional regulator with XRE-family HTH domain